MVELERLGVYTMTRHDIINFCKTFPAAYEDYPFDASWTAMRHRTNHKTFAFIYERNGRLCVNLKCEPLRADFLRSIYRGVKPAYHMNKVHWNTVIIGEDVPENELFAMVEHSYGLICPKVRKKHV